jgi:phosphoglucosamine mutase
MEAEGWHLGGESSGHIICSDITTTGDGIVAALQVLRAVRESGENLGILRAGMRKYPQTMINVRAAGKVNLDEHAGVAEAVAGVEATLGERGRVLLRPSGTEPVVRVMVEGEEQEEVNGLCRQLADEVERCLS